MITVFCIFVIMFSVGHLCNAFDNSYGWQNGFTAFVEVIMLIFACIVLAFQ